jgi:two-component system chemotaxis sensor kinase CheA
MSLSTKIREQLINSFRAELSEHVQTMNDGLLALEQGRVKDDERQSMLGDIFRAPPLSGYAPRAIGVTVIEQLAHALEGVLDGLQKDTIESSPELYTACYGAVDAIQAVQTAYEAGETTPPMEAIKALADLETFRPAACSKAKEAQVEKAPAIQATPLPASRSRRVRASQPVAAEEAEAEPIEAEADGGDGADHAPGSTSAALGLGGNGTIRVGVKKLDALMNQLNELLAAKIRAEQQLNRMRALQDLVAQWQKEWLAARGTVGRLARHEKSGLLSAHKLKSIDELRGGAFAVAEGNTFRTQFAAHTWLEGEWAAPADKGSGNGSGEGGTLTQALRDLGKDVAQVLGYVDANQSQLREMQALVNDMARQYVSDTTYMGMVTDDLEQEIKRVRMLPLATITGPFGRMVRDLAQQAGKEAVLEIVGADTELDKQVLEQIKDPLVHLLRNAVDHGIEPPAQREQHGKPRAVACADRARRYRARL